MNCPKLMSADSATRCVLLSSLILQFFRIYLNFTRLAMTEIRAINAYSLPNFICSFKEITDV